MVVFILVLVVVISKEI